MKIRPFCLLAVCIGLFLSFSSLSSQTKNEPNNKRHALHFYAKERHLTVVELLNVSKNDFSLVNHLGATLAKWLAHRLASLAYIPVTFPQQVLGLSTSPGLMAAAGSVDQEKSQAELKRYYYSHIDSAGGGEVRLDRVRLLVDYQKKSSRELEKILKIGSLQAAKAMKTDYLITGSLTVLDGQAEFLRYDLEFCDAVRNRIFHFSVKKVNRRRPYIALNALVSQIEKVLLGKRAVDFSLVTDKPGARIYLDGVHIGRTPIDRRLVTGTYELRVLQEGYDSVVKTLTVRSGQKNHFHIHNVIREQKAALFVRSDPSGARVYLNMQYLGTTPLKSRSLPAGTHRLRISKQGYIDRHVGVLLKADQTQRLELQMQAGDTLSYYLDPQYAIGTLTYYDLGLYSGLSSVVFYGARLFFQAREQRILDQAEPDDQKSRKEARANSRYAAISTGLGVASLLSAIYFVYCGVEANDRREFGEVSIRSKARPVWATSFNLSHLPTGQAYYVGLSLGF